MKEYLSALYTRLLYFYWFIHPFCQLRKKKREYNPLMVNILLSNFYFNWSINLIYCDFNIRYLISWMDIIIPEKYAHTSISPMLLLSYKTVFFGPLFYTPFDVNGTYLIIQFSFQITCQVNKRYCSLLSDSMITAVSTSVPNDLDILAMFSNWFHWYNML
jgi:hypothetical protein